MARREYTMRLTCAAKPCPESQTYVYDTMRDREESHQFYRRNPWHCAKHSTPEKVLTPERLTIRTALTVGPPGDRFRKTAWLKEDGSREAAFVYGAGFKAFAEDFPEGTRLTITVTAELPTGGAL